MPLSHSRAAASRQRRSCSSGGLPTASAIGPLIDVQQDLAELKSTSELLQEGCLEVKQGGVDLHEGRADEHVCLTCGAESFPRRRFRRPHKAFEAAVVGGACKERMKVLQAYNLEKSTRHSRIDSAVGDTHVVLHSVQQNTK